MNQISVHMRSIEISLTDKTLWVGSTHKR
jgi:hypothetical protein